MEQIMFIIISRVSQVRIKSHVWSQRGEHNLNWARWSQMKCVFLYHLPLASSSPHVDALWHHYSSTVAWSWQEQYLCNSPAGSQWHWLHSPWIWSGQCPWIPGTGEKQEKLIRGRHIYLGKKRGILLMYEYVRQLRRSIFPLGGIVQLGRGTSSPTMVWTWFSHRFWTGHILQLPPRETNNHINNSWFTRKLEE